MVEPLSAQEILPQQELDTRRQARKPLFLRIADAGPDTAILMDISVGGALLRASQPLAVGDPVTINLPHGPAAEARVTWSSGPLAGCQFVTPITDAMVSAALLKSEPVVTEETPSLIEAYAHDAPNSARMAYGIPIIVGISVLLWSAIAGAVALI